MRRQLIAAPALAAMCVLAAGCNTPQRETAPTPTTTTTTRPPAPPVAVTSLDGLLLSPDQINTAMGATAMTVATTPTTMDDDSAHVADKACLPLWSSLEPTVYVRWTDFRAQELKDPGTIRDEIHGQIQVADFDHFASQGVVLLPSAQDAGAFFTTSAQSWPGCANRQYTATVTGYPDQLFTVGPVANTNGTLSATQTIGDANWLWESCQRALTVANNVAIDVEACSRVRSDSQSDAAVNIAHQIAAKVPTT